MAKVYLLVVRRLAAVGFVMLVLASSAVAQNLVLNPGFETGDFTSWTTNDPSEFTFVTINNPHTGTYSAQTGPSGSLRFISQDLSTAAATTYTLNFFLANNGNGSIAEPNEFTASFDGVTLTDLVNSVTFSYTEFTFSGLVATSSSTPLKFGFRNEPGYFFLDDVSVVAAIPEPSSLALLGFGAAAGCLAWLVAHRRLLPRFL